MSQVKRMLFFNDADNDAVSYPLDNLLSIGHEGDDTVFMRFKASRPMSLQTIGTTAAAAVAGYDQVTLNTNAGITAKDVFAAIVAKFNEPAIGGAPNFITIADDINSVYVHSDITGCNIILSDINPND